jgi:alkylation response protein AidB-like acyl-CoA dehydrogenase
MAAVIVTPIVPSIPTGPQPLAPEYVARARLLAPAIAAASDRTERDRRIAPDVFDALMDAGMFRLLLPRSLNGAEVDPITFVHVVEEIAAADASTAWVLCQTSGCSMASAYMPEATAWDVFGRDPRALLAWGPGPGARAVAVDGGYRVTGRWSFASGCRHANWLGAYCPVHEPDGAPRRRPGGGQEARVMLVPAADATIADVWHVIGLRGTASDTFSVSDLFVPQERSLVRDDPSERRQAGPLYCFPIGSLYSSGFAGLALGIARAALDGFVGLATEKVARGARGTLRESAVVQSQVAQGHARLASARLYLVTSLDEIWRSVSRAGSVALEHRIQIRLASTFAIHAAREVVDTVYQAAGTTSVFASSAFERRFRDMHAVTQQLQGRLSHFETVGQFLLGLPPDTAFL